MDANNLMMMVQETMGRLDNLALSGVVEMQWRRGKLGRIAAVYGELLLHCDGIEVLPSEDIEALAAIFWGTVSKHFTF